MPLHTTEAIIIGGHDLAEADRIVVFYTRRPEKSAPWRKGSGASEASWWARAALQPGAAGLFRAGQQDPAQGERVCIRSIHINACGRISTGSRWPRWRSRRWPWASRTATPSPTSINCWQKPWTISKASRPAVVLQGFLLHLLRLLGYRPEFSECVRCRAPLLTRVEAFLSPAGGGAVCASCRPGATDAFAAVDGIPRVSARWGGSTLHLMDRIALPPATLREVTATIQAFLRQVLGRPLRSADFLRCL